MSDPEIDKILNKAFEDIKKRINSVIAKREKKLVKEIKTVKPDSYNAKKPDSKKTDDRSKGRPRKEHASSSSSYDTDSSDSR